MWYPVNFVYTIGTHNLVWRVIDRSTSSGLKKEYILVREHRWNFDFLWLYIVQYVQHRNKFHQTFIIKIRRYRVVKTTSTSFIGSTYTIFHSESWSWSCGVTHKDLFSILRKDIFVPCYIENRLNCLIIINDVFFKNIGISLVPIYYNMCSIKYLPN